MSTYKTSEIASRGKTYAAESTPWYGRYVTPLPRQFRPLAAVGLRGVYGAVLEVGGDHALARWSSLFVENPEGGVDLNPQIGQDFADIEKSRVYKDLQGSAAVVLLATGAAAVYENSAARMLRGKPIARLSAASSTATAIIEASRREPERLVKLPRDQNVSQVSVRWHQDLTRPEFSPNLDVTLRYTNNDLSMLQVRQNDMGPAAQYLECELAKVEDSFLAGANLSQRTGPATLRTIGNAMLIIVDRPVVL